MLSTAEHGGGEDSPLTHPAAAPSRLHNFNIKSWGKQRHLRRCTNLHARSTKPADQTARMWSLREEKDGEGGVEAQAVDGISEKVEEKEERRTFCVSLTKEEIEEDVYAMKGTRPARRPKKRPKAVQRKIDDLVVTM